MVISTHEHENYHEIGNHEYTAASYSCLKVSPLILLARCMSLLKIVTLPACKAQRLTSSKSPTT